MGCGTVAIYDRAFSSDALVSMHTDRVGNQLKPNADVKVRGVVVGTVSTITASAAGADIQLSIDPDKLNLLPSNISARLLPKTLFGQRYISLVIPDEPSSTPLADGDRIRQDTSERAIELERALRDLIEVLQAVQPQKLASTLGAISQALENRGKPLGETMVALDAYLAKL